MYTSESQKELVGFLFNSVLAFPMATAAGLKLFSRPDVNSHFRNILKSWAVSLDSPASTSVLNGDSKGWLCEEALDAMARVVTDAIPTLSTTFAQAYLCNTTLPFHGYKSRDDFFTRKWRDGLRPTASPDDGNVLQHMRIQPLSSPYRIAYNVKMQDQFALKKQPYSLLEMLDNDPLAEKFDGGSVYQAFLSALSNHRWHAPVAGKIIKIVHIAGTYFLQNAFEGFANLDSTGKPTPDPAAPNKSQACLCQDEVLEDMVLEDKVL